LNHFENYKPNDEDFEKLLEQLDEEDDSSELDFSNMDRRMKERVMTTDSQTGRDSILDVVAPK
jgi:hypothetical protein